MTEPGATEVNLLTQPAPLGNVAKDASAAKRHRIPGFSSIGAVNWLQGRWLIPLLAAHGARVMGTVVDVGCGRTPFRPLFPRALKFVRIDCSDVDSQVITANAPALPLDSASVDFILLAQVIGDMPDLVKFFRELHRVLVPSGIVLVYEAISYPEHDLSCDCWRVLPAGLEWAAGQAGLSVVRVEYLGGYFTQLGMHWNELASSMFDRLALTRPIGWLLRAAGNLTFAGLDALASRPTLATDYFACLTKAPAGVPPAIEKLTR